MAGNFLCHCALGDIGSRIPGVDTSTRRGRVSVTFVPVLTPLLATVILPPWDLHKTKLLHDTRAVQSCARPPAYVCGREPKSTSNVRKLLEIEHSPVKKALKEFGEVKNKKMIIKRKMKYFVIRNVVAPWDMAPFLGPMKRKMKSI